MQFDSFDFFVFFPIVLAIYFVVPKKVRTYWLLAASYFFYICWNPAFSILLLASTVTTFLCGFFIDVIRNKATNNSNKYIKLIIIACLIINLGILAFFKYTNFVLASINSVLVHMNISIAIKQLDILLPVGISFYTFRALSYIIDVYRKDVDVEKNFFRYALFVSFFPQILAGPIDKSKNFLPQLNNIENIKLWNAKRIASGAILMVWGYFLKMVISDRISIIVDNVFSNYHMYGSVELFLAAIGFTIQIYTDFSSYSMLAIGAGKIMGFDVMENFNTPYFATNVRDFWSRWHISLSTWFRDYLYIPLGGNRKGKFRKELNIFIVFLVSGLWHGANWTFLIWGGIHGLFQIIGDISSPFKKKLVSLFKIKTDTFSYRLLQTIITFLLVTFAWIFFKADSISQAGGYIGRMFTRHTPWVLFNGGLYELGLDRVEMNILLVGLVILILVSIVRYKKNQTLDAFLMSQNIWFEWVVIIGLILMIFVFGEYGAAFDAQQFIYFNF